jgi:hypothetical protein
MVVVFTIKAMKSPIRFYICSAPVVAAVLVLSGMLLAGCGRGGYTGSGVPAAVAADSLVEHCGSAQGARVAEQTGGGGTDLQSAEQHRQYTVSIESGTPGQFMTSLRSEVEKLVFASGQTLYGPETVVPAELRDFALRYAGPHHKGMVRAYTADHSTNRFRLIIWCYEHRT